MTWHVTILDTTRGRYGTRMPTYDTSVLYMVNVCWITDTWSDLVEQRINAGGDEAVGARSAESADGGGFDQVCELRVVRGVEPRVNVGCRWRGGRKGRRLGPRVEREREGAGGSGPLRSASASLGGVRSGLPQPSLAWCEAVRAERVGGARSGLPRLSLASARGGASGAHRRRAVRLVATGSRFGARRCGRSV